MPGPLDQTERLDWLQLCRSGGVGPRTFFKLVRRFGSARRAYQELPRLAREAGGEARWRRARRDEVEAELEALTRLGGRLVAWGEPDYPRFLAEIHDPPPLLALRGASEAIGEPGVAIVGARNASANGRVFAHHLAREAADAGFAVVSGLARGIDTAAHEGALAGGGLTVAVLASGVDVAYPPDNAGLLQRIIERGAVVSERPLGAEPQARHFPRRNRLIAGLCCGVVVVEAAPQSGSLITARLALEQGREVMAVPGSPLDPRHRGTNRLLREGATLVECAADVLAALGAIRRPPPPCPTATAAAARPRAGAQGPAAPATTPEAAAPPAAPGAQPRCSDTLRLRVREHLGAEPLLVDELIRQCGAGAAQVQHALLELEIDGLIERHPGNRVSLASG